MLRWTRLIAPVAGLALLVGMQQAQLRAADAAEGKATVTVTVVDSAGKAVSGATVGIYPKPAKHKKTAAAEGATTQPTADAKPAKPEAIETGETGADGSVALSKVPDGEFVVRAKVKGSNGQSPVTVADGKDSTVSITLKARTKTKAN